MTPASVAVKVFIQTSAGTDGQLLYEAVNLAANKSGLISQLAMRGWLNLLHGMSPVERSIQLRMIGFPDDVIAQIDAAIPNPQFLGLESRTFNESAQAPMARADMARPSPRPMDRKKELPPTAATVATAVEPVPSKASEQTSEERATPSAPPASAQAEPTQIFQPPMQSRLGDPFIGGGLA